MGEHHTDTRVQTLVKPHANTHTATHTNAIRVCMCALQTLVRLHTYARAHARAHTHTQKKMLPQHKACHTAQLKSTDLDAR